MRECQDLVHACDNLKFCNEQLLKRLGAAEAENARLRERADNATELLAEALVCLRRHVSR